MIINLTQHMATPEQGAMGVVDLPEAYSERADLVRLLTIEELPSAEDLYCRADQLVDLVRESSLDVPIGTAVMIGGAPYLLAHLERALIVAGYRPVYAFSRRESVDSPGADGRVTKTAVFRHAGWVMVASPVSQAASALSKSKAGKPKAAQASRDNGAKGGRPSKYTYSGYQAHLGLTGDNTCEIPDEVAADQRAYDGKTFPARVLTGYRKGSMMRVRLIGDDYGLNTSGTGDVIVRPVSLIQTARKG